jgi:hypothetical protein
MKMNKKDIFNKVGTIINELNEQYDYLSQSPDNLNGLELELLSAHANFLSDHITVLIKLCDDPRKLEGSISRVPAEAEIDKKTLEVATEKVPDVQPVTSEDKNEEDKRSAWVFEMKDEQDSPYNLINNKEQTAHQPVKDEPLVEKEEHKVNIEPVKISEPPVKMQDPAAGSRPDEEPVIRESVISEKTVHIPVEETSENKPEPTLNDLLSRSNAKRNTENQFSAKQVKDLKSMINMNDKLLFVRDLFNGYSLAYSEAIELLNRFDDLDAADNFLKQNYAAKNNWASRQEVADHFYEILSRRFSK